MRKSEFLIWVTQSNDENLPLNEASRWLVVVWFSVTWPLIIFPMMAVQEENCTGTQSYYNHFSQIALAMLCYNPFAVGAVLSILQLPQSGLSVISSKTYSAGWGSCGKPIRSLSKFSTGQPFANTIHEKLSFSFKLGNRNGPRLFNLSLKSYVSLSVNR